MCLSGVDVLQKAARMVNIEQGDDGLLNGEANNLDLLHDVHGHVPDVRVRRRDAKVEDDDWRMEQHCVSTDHAEDCSTDLAVPDHQVKSRVEDK